MFRVTPLVRNLIIINVVIFFAQMLLPLSSDRCEEYAFSPGISGFLSLWPIGSCPFAAYQLFTYMFAHGGFMHIFFNMFALASFAPILESYWGERKLLFFYIATGIGAGIIYAGVNYLAFTFHWGETIPFFSHGSGPMLGASGAIYGILMAFGMVFPNLEIMLLFPPIPLKAKYMVFVIGLVTYVMDRSGGVAHLAHFGGAFTGFLIIRYWRSTGGL